MEILWGEISKEKNIQSLGPMQNKPKLSVYISTEHCLPWSVSGVVPRQPTSHGEDGSLVFRSWRGESKLYYVVHFSSVDQQADINVDVDVKGKQPKQPLAFPQYANTPRHRKQQKCSYPWRKKSDGKPKLMCLAAGKTHNFFEEKNLEPIPTEMKILSST